MQSQATTVAAYLAELPPDRQAAIKKVRAVVRKNLPKGFAEQMQYGMISYVVPHKLYPAGYHCNPKDAVPFAALASQKNHMSLYLMAAYSGAGSAEWLKAEFAKRNKKFDMGKSCLRFKKLEDLPLDVLGEFFTQTTVAEYIEMYEKQKPRR